MFEICYKLFSGSVFLIRIYLEKHLTKKPFSDEKYIIVFADNDLLKLTISSHNID